MWRHKWGQEKHIDNMQQCQKKPNETENWANNIQSCQSQGFLLQNICTTRIKCQSDSCKRVTAIDISQKNARVIIYGLSSIKSLINSFSYDHVIICSSCNSIRHVEEIYERIKFVQQYEKDIASFWGKNKSYAVEGILLDREGILYPKLLSVFISNTSNRTIQKWTIVVVVWGHQRVERVVFIILSIKLDT